MQSMHESIWKRFRSVVRGFGGSAAFLTIDQRIQQSCFTLERCLSNATDHEMSKRQIAWLLPTCDEILIWSPPNYSIQIQIIWQCVDKRLEFAFVSTAISLSLPMTVLIQLDGSKIEYELSDVCDAFFMNTRSASSMSVSVTQIERGNDDSAPNPTIMSP